VQWKSTYRLIPSKYPPIDMFERIAPAADWMALQQLEALTNPRVRDAVGDIQLVPINKRVSGPGATIVMAPFTHCSTSRPTRFTDGRYGIYYAARTFDTALLEVAHHMGRFHAATRDAPTVDHYRSYKGTLNKVMHDIRGGGFTHLLRPDAKHYGRSQAFARALRSAGSNGIVYPSVRHATGECLAAFWPNVVTIPSQERHVELKWDGSTISQWLDDKTETWRPLPK
jgi:hypothetical protein